MAVTDEFQLARQAVIERFHSGEAWAALEDVRALRQRAPERVEALRLHGELCEALGLNYEAARVRRELVEGAPDHAGLLLGLAEEASNAGDHALALDAMERVLKLENAPSASRLTQLARLALLSHDATRALEHTDQAVSIDPRFVPAHVTRARALMVLGRLDEAARQCRLAVGKAPDEPHVLTAALGISPDRELIELARQRLKRGAITPAIRRDLGCALAVALAEFGEHPEAAELAREVKSPYDQSAHQALVQLRERSEGALTLYDRIASEPRPAPRGGPSPIFIVAPPRSGTSLTERVIADTRESLVPLGERGDALLPVHDWLIMARALGTERAARAFQESAADVEDTIRARWRAAAPGARFVTDKTPAQIDVAGLLSVIFPDARFVHVRRDPLDIGYSQHLRAFPAGYAYTDALGPLADALLIQQRQGEAWANRLGERWIDLDYGVLAGDVDREAAQLRERLGLAPESGESGTYKSQTFSARQLQSPVSGPRTGQWRACCEHLGELIERFPNHAS